MASGEARIIREKMTSEQILQLAKDTFGDMVKIVVDVEQGVLAAGGMLHADAESLLIDGGSSQSDIWGANYFPQKAPGSRLEFTALINIRPSDGNRDQFIQSEPVRGKVQEIAERWMGPL